ncbi:MAG: hypothetical protein KGI60_01440 [Patescibacteria group bacterium]|nr:hypothetical protein [Patescibacteria group bacterium]
MEKIAMGIFVAVALAALVWRPKSIGPFHKKKKDIGPPEPTLRYSREAVNHQDALIHGFRDLVHAIKCEEARKQGKELVLREDEKCPEGKLITEHDVDDAFRQALNELRTEESECHACDDSLLDRIKRLCGRHQKKTP